MRISGIIFQRFKSIKCSVFVCPFQVVILEHKSIICPGYTAVLHLHNAVEEVTLVVSSKHKCLQLKGGGVSWLPTLFQLKYNQF